MIGPKAALLREAVVLGIGQPMAGDDGVGIAVARKRAGTGRAVREATDASVLLTLLEEGRRVVLVDAVLGPGNPGDVVRLRPESLASDLTPLSSHGVTVIQALELARNLFGEAATCDVEIVGVIIEQPEAPRAELSPAVAAAVGPAARLAASIAAPARAIAQ